LAEGDTIHRLAGRLTDLLGGREVERADAPNRRSPLHGRAGDLEGKVVEVAEARGKHLVVHFSEGLALHSHLGIKGSFRIGERARHGSPWLVLASGSTVAAQYGGKVLRLVPEARLRNDPTLARLGPDVLAPEFTVSDGVAALRGGGREREVGDALLDQALLAGVGNVYRAEGLFAARISPWRRLADLADPELERVVGETAALMRAGLETGRRPHDVYRRAGQPCLRCGEHVRSRGQGDNNRTVYWCPGCQA
jgi:endonuclease-8